MRAGVIDTDVTLLDRIASLLAAASLCTELSVRTIYVAEAKIQLEAARQKLASLGSITAAEELELVRMKAALK